MEQRANRPTTLAQRVTSGRLATGLNQSQFAKEIGISPGALNKLENGVSKSLKGATLAAMSRRFQCSAFWLETGLGTREANPELSPREHELIYMYNQMPPHVREQWYLIGKTLMPPAPPATNVHNIRKPK